MTVRVGPPEPETLDTLVELWVALADEQRDHGSRLLAGENRDQIREAMARHLVTGGVLVAVDGANELLGFVMFGPETGVYATDRDRGIVHNIYVRPDRRGEGVGTRLLETAEAMLDEQGVDVVSLEVMADNDAARRFYDRNGYRPHRITMEKSVESDIHSNQ